MLTFDGRRIRLVAGAVDMRKSFYGFSGVVRDRLGADPVSRYLCLFCNRHRNRLDVLVADESCMWVLSKRLDRGRFAWPAIRDSVVCIEYREAQLALLLRGFDIDALQPRRWHPPRRVHGARQSEVPRSGQGKPNPVAALRGLFQQRDEIEREADEAGLSGEARTELRQLRSKPIVLEIHQHAWRIGGEFHAAGAMAMAIGYVRTQLRALRTYLEDGRIPFDNDACERSIRPIATGRRKLRPAAAAPSRVVATRATASCVAAVRRAPGRDRGRRCAW